MKVRFAQSTSCPYGQFIITSENEADVAIQSTFLKAPSKDWKFWLHGVGGDVSKQSFNFGWIKRNKESISVGELRRLGFKIPVEVYEGFPIPDRAIVDLKFAEPELQSSEDGPSRNTATFIMQFDVEWECS